MNINTLKTLLITITIFFAGCATNNGGPDPYENVNRKYITLIKKLMNIYKTNC